MLFWKPPNMLFEYLLSLVSHIALFWSLKFMTYTSNTLIYLVWTTTILATRLQLHLLSDSFHIVTGAEYHRIGNLIYSEMMNKSFKVSLWKNQHNFLNPTRHLP